MSELAKKGGGGGGVKIPDMWGTDVSPSIIDVTREPAGAIATFMGGTKGVMITLALATNNQVYIGTIINEGSCNVYDSSGNYKTEFYVTKSGSSYSLCWHQFSSGYAMKLSYIVITID